MTKTTRHILAFAALMFAAAGLISCGGSNGGGSSSASVSNSAATAALPGGSTGAIVAQVGASTITKSTLDHWIKTLAGGDYFESSQGHVLPAGLVLDPPNYSGCVSQLETAATSHRSKKQPTPTAAELLGKCRELNQSIKKQAISYVINAERNILLDGELGLTASPAEVTNLFNHLKVEEFPTPALLQRYLSNHHWSLEDEMLLVKLDVLGQKLLHAIEVGGKATYAKFIQASARWTAKTDCRPGYVVLHCKQFTGEKPAPKSGAVLMEEVAAILTHP